MNSRRRWAASVLGLLLTTLAALAEPTVGPWAPMYTGIEYATGEATEPRLQKVFAVRIDLRAPGIEFLSTPDNGDLPAETTSETALEFLNHQHVQVAINANFFSPCCDPGDKDLRGLAISRGHVVSEPLRTGRGSAVLLITRDNVARITTTQEPLPLGDVWTAVAGSELVLVKGETQTFPSGHFHTADHPRSAVGLTKDGRYLILMVIDGRQPGYSLGAPMEDVAAWLRRFGAYDGLNLDGGGSSALVRAGEHGAVLLNHPSGAAKPFGDDRDLVVTHGTLRSDGNHLGVFAKPLSASVPR